MFLLRKKPKILDKPLSLVKISARLVDKLGRDIPIFYRRVTDGPSRTCFLVGKRLRFIYEQR